MSKTRFKIGDRFIVTSEYGYGNITFNKGEMVRITDTTRHPSRMCDSISLISSHFSKVMSIPSGVLSGYIDLGYYFRPVELMPIYPTLQVGDIVFARGVAYTVVADINNQLCAISHITFEMSKIEDFKIEIDSEFNFEIEKAYRFDKINFVDYEYEDNMLIITTQIYPIQPKPQPEPKVKVKLTLSEIKKQFNLSLENDEVEVDFEN
jgi:hypothetical protein